MADKELASFYYRKALNIVSDIEDAKTIKDAKKLAQQAEHALRLLASATDTTL